MIDSVKINFVGDVALFKHFQRKNIDPLKDIKLPVSDYSIANFEFPVSKEKIKKFYDASDEYIIDYKYAKSLNLDKFDLYGLANNHINDYGSEGIEATCDLIESSGCSFFGLKNNDEFDVYYKEVKNVKFAYIAAVKSGRWKSDESDQIGPCIIDFGRLNTLVKKLSKSSDIDHIIIYLHWGTELVDAPIVSDVHEARRLIDNGASSVIGHHPHVIQGIEEYKGGLIAYSLGSFIYLSEFEKGNFDRASIRDISMCLNIEYDKSSIINYVGYKYTRQDGKLVPELTGYFNECSYFEHLKKVVGDNKYYSSKVRSVLLVREFRSFIVRFKENPLKTLSQYLRYIKFEHIRKIIGISK
ncbi:MAG: CapA family protein [Moritella sp.]|uniref:CapA family protein n=1 Tax=Moritella sp. TaxID=78556 RepID=UPI001DB6293F|nr:CapA family protein [Moritella sp.]NQZ48910.1 CapA family protein [Moritella sp.]